MLSKSKHIKYEYSNGKDRVFLSYQRESFDFVLKLSEYLEANGIKTWYAPRNIKLAGLWPEKLHEAVENCRCLLLLYTRHADKSKHVIREVSIADDYNKPILWLKLDKSEPESKVLKYFLKLVQTVECDKEGVLFETLSNALSPDSINFSGLKDSLKLNTSSTEGLSTTQWSKGIYAFDTADEAAECAARVYFEKAKVSPERTLLLPTGRSAKRVFQAMLRLATGEYAASPFGDCYLMNDTETFGVSMNHPTSRVRAIRENLINILSAMNRAPEESRLLFFGQGDDCLDPEDAAAQNLANHPPVIHGISISPYMEIIGYDLGRHTGDIVNDGPRVVEVTDETREYIDAKQKSHSIYTVGLKTALATDILLMLAFESDKSNAIERLFKEDVDPSVPVTLLRNHENAYLITTKEIVSRAGLENHAIKNLSPTEAAKCIMNQI
ncbi:MAG: TIR domain-containing protein [Clostridia bacterium]|nr:TIR domain-containing protein [Clostridia bacterium]